jgi:hypothetical protein
MLSNAFTVRIIYTVHCFPKVNVIFVISKRTHNLLRILFNELK